MKILCLTPIKHLDGIYEHLESFGVVDYHPDVDRINVGGLIDSFNYDVIFCNPNKQSYKLDKSILNNLAKLFIENAKKYNLDKIEIFNDIITPN